MKMNGMKGALKRVSPCTASTSASDPAMMMKRRSVMLRVESCFSASLSGQSTGLFLHVMRQDKCYLCGQNFD